MKMYLDQQQLHVLFREVENHCFPETLTKFVIHLDGKRLVEESTPRKSCNANNGVDYLAKLVMVPSEVKVAVKEVGMPTILLFR